MPAPDYEKIRKQLAKMRSDKSKPNRLRTMLPLSGRLSLTDLCYADIDEIRAVFSERRHQLWLAQWKRPSKRDPEKLMELQKKAFSTMFEMSPIGRCNRILEACQDVEDQIQAALRATQAALDES